MCFFFFRGWNLYVPPYPFLEIRLDLECLGSCLIFFYRSSTLSSTWIRGFLFHCLFSETFVLLNTSGILLVLFFVSLERNGFFSIGRLNLLMWIEEGFFNQDKKQTWLFQKKKIAGQPEDKKKKLQGIYSNPLPIESFLLFVLFCLK